MQTLADRRGWSPFMAQQIEFSLAERTVEHKLIPMAAGVGLSVLPWSPLGGSLLSGTYSRANVAQSRNPDVSVTRKGVIASSGHLTEHALATVEAVQTVARQTGAMPSQMAPAWTLTNLAVASPVMDARTVAQAGEDLCALGLGLSPEQV